MTIRVMVGSGDPRELQLLAAELKRGDRKADIWTGTGPKPMRLVDLVFEANGRELIGIYEEVDESELRGDDAGEREGSAGGEGGGAGAGH